MNSVSLPSSNICSICLNSFEPKKLDLTQIFHQNCFYKWAQLCKMTGYDSTYPSFHTHIRKNDIELKKWTDILAIENVHSSTLKKLNYEKAARIGNLHFIATHFVKTGIPNNETFEKIYLYAFQNGHSKIIDLLSSCRTIAPSIKEIGLVNAIKNGQFSIIKKIIQDPDISEYDWAGAIQELFSQPNNCFVFLHLIPNLPHHITKWMLFYSASKNFHLITKTLLHNYHFPEPTLYWVILNCAKNNSLDSLKTLFQFYHPPTEFLEMLSINACQSNHTPLALYLFNQAPSSLEVREKCLIQAIKNNNTKIFYRLIASTPLSNFHIEPFLQELIINENTQIAIKLIQLNKEKISKITLHRLATYAAMNNKYEVLLFLLFYIPPLPTTIEKTLKTAIQYNSLIVAIFLRKMCKLSENGFLDALQIGFEYKRIEILKNLLAIKPIEETTYLFCKDLAQKYDLDEIIQFLHSDAVSIKKTIYSSCNLL